MEICGNRADHSVNRRARCALPALHLLMMPNGVFAAGLEGVGRAKRSVPAAAMAGTRFALCPPYGIPFVIRSLMPRYQRAHVAGGTFFFTVTTADRSGDLLV